MRFPKSQVVRLKGKALEALRLSCYLRDGGRCVVCGKRVSLLGSLWVRMNSPIILCGRGGPDVLSNVESRCNTCHLVNGHNPKPCPPKERNANT